MDSWHTANNIYMCYPVLDIQVFDSALEFACGVYFQQVYSSVLDTC